MRLANKIVLLLIILTINLLLSTNLVFAFPPPRPGLVDEQNGVYRRTGLPTIKMGDHVLKPTGKIIPSRLQVNAPEGVAAGTVPQEIDAGSPSITPVVFLVDFSDRPQHRAAADFFTLFFGTGPIEKSVANYWSEVSYGSFTVAGNSSDIRGWLRPGVDFASAITQNSQLADIFFGLNFPNFLTLLNDLVSSLDASVDFSRYDADGDGIVDSAIFVHAGYGGEDTGDTINDIWSQTIFFPGSAIATGDGVSIVDCVVVPEEKFYNDPDGIDNGDEDLVGIGVIVHEMGHLMGLPDLYPTTTQGGVTGNFSGVGVFDLMGFGLWGNSLLLDQDTPAHLSAWSKMFLGWLNPVELSTTSFANILAPVEAAPEAFKVLINGPGDPTQYILIENRQITDTTVPDPAWLFDNSLPGTGVVIWHVDEDVINGGLATNSVNIDPDFKGLDVEEADGGDELDQTITGATPNDRAIFFGDLGDFFRDGTQVFDRDNPNPGMNETNSSPITSSDHPVDFGIDVSLTNFTIFPQNIDIDGLLFTVNSVLFDLTVSGGGIPPSVPDWRTFNQVSTAPSEGFTNGPIVSDDINVIGQDSSNAVWFGTADRGISRLTGRTFEVFNSTSDDLPSDTVTAFAFNENTGVMWVGTDNGIARMRDRGNGFELVPDTLFFPGVVVNDLAIDGDGFLWIASDSGLSLIDDGGTDSASDDIFVPSIRPGSFRAVTVSPGGNLSPLFDVIFAYDNTGRILYRSSDPDDVLQFISINLPLNPIANDLAVDLKGFIWIATQNNGVLVYDDKLTEDISDDELDPLDVDNNTITDETVFITTAQNIASNRVTGITLQDIQGQAEPIAYFSHRNDGVNDGGVTRVDLNVDPVDRFIPGDGLTLYREDPAVLPELEIAGPASNLVRSAFTGRSGNIWFSTDNGASRFGNAGILTLDSTTYLNLDAVATVTLEDEGLNFDAGSINVAVVFVTSDSDPVGFVLILKETGDDTGIFREQFGFTAGASFLDPGGLNLLSIQTSNTLTVTYNDGSPPGVRTATATWSSIFPFEDDLLIEGCFIATAAFGSHSSPMVRIFRDFRDEYLTGNGPGRFLATLYYRFSPDLARVIERSPAARFAVRSFLVPTALLTGFGMNGTLPENGIIFFAVVFLVSFFDILRIRKSNRIQAGNERVRKRKIKPGE